METKVKYFIDTDLYNDCLQNAITVDCLCEIIANITIISSKLKKDIELHLKGGKNDQTNRS